MEDDNCKDLYEKMNECVALNKGTHLCKEFINEYDKCKGGKSIITSVKELFVKKPEENTDENTDENKD